MNFLVTEMSTMSFLNRNFKIHHYYHAFLSFYHHKSTTHLETAPSAEDLE